MTANAPYIKASSYGRPSTNSEDRFFCSLLEKLEYERPKETTDNKKDYTIVSRIFTTPQGTILTIALYRRIEPTIRASKDVETGAVKIVPNKVDDGINSIIDKMRKEQSFHLAKEIAITNHWPLIVEQLTKQLRRSKSSNKTALVSVTKPKAEPATQSMSFSAPFIEELTPKSAASSDSPISNSQNATCSSPQATSRKPAIDFDELQLLQLKLDSLENRLDSRAQNWNHNLRLGNVTAAINVVCLAAVLVTLVVFGYRAAGPAHTAYKSDVILTDDELRVSLLAKDQTSLERILRDIRYPVTNGAEIAESPSAGSNPINASCENLRRSTQVEAPKTKNKKKKDKDRSDI